MHSSQWSTKLFSLWFVLLSLLVSIVTYAYFYLCCVFYFLLGYFLIAVVLLVSLTPPFWVYRIIVDDEVNWQPHDKIVLSSSSYEPHEAEVLTIKEIKGYHIRIYERLRHRHIGKALLCWLKEMGGPWRIVLTARPTIVYLFGIKSGRRFSDYCPVLILETFLNFIPFFSSLLLISSPFSFPLLSSFFPCFLLPLMFFVCLRQGMIK